MPSLVLQPLVENAVYHGIGQLPAGGTVVVKVRADRGRVLATVENPLPLKPRSSEGNRIAVANIEQRLHALYGTQAELRASNEGGRYRVELSYPQGDPG